MNERKNKESVDEKDERIDSIEKKMADILNKISKSKKKKNKLTKIEKSVTIDEILTEEECKRLLDVCDNSKHPLENNFLVQTMMKIGFRVAEVTHLNKKWINFEKQTITIPPHEPCDDSYCLSRIKAQLKTMGKNKEEQERIGREKVMKYYWQPKTPASVRVVYYGFDPDYARILEEYFSKYDRWPLSHGCGASRIRKMLDLAGLKNHVAHHLRKTAGSNFAAKGFTEQQLMDVMGWDDSEVAREYIRLFGARSIEAQKRVLGDGKKKGVITDSRVVFSLISFGRQVCTRKKSRDEEEWLRDVLFSKESKKYKTISDYV